MRVIPSGDQVSLRICQSVVNYWDTFDLRAVQSIMGARGPFSEAQLQLQRVRYRDAVQTALRDTGLDSAAPLVHGAVV